MKYFVRQHAGGLKESLKTMKKIDKETFKRYLPMYEYYGYDERCNQLLWIRVNHQHHTNEPTWLGIEL